MTNPLDPKPQIPRNMQEFVQMGLNREREKYRELFKAWQEENEGLPSDDFLEGMSLQWGIFITEGVARDGTNVKSPEFTEIITTAVGNHNALLHEVRDLLAQES